MGFLDQIKGDPLTIEFLMPRINSCSLCGHEYACTFCGVCEKHLSSSGINGLVRLKVSDYITRWFVCLGTFKSVETLSPKNQLKLKEFQSLFFEAAKTARFEKAAELAEAHRLREENFQKEIDKRAAAANEVAARRKEELAYIDAKKSLDPDEVLARKLSLIPY